MDDDTFTPTAPLTWQGVCAVLSSGVSGLFDEAAGVFEGLSSLFAADHNYQQDRRTFHERAALEMEALIRRGE